MQWKKIGLGIGGLFLSGAALGSTLFFAHRKRDESALSPPYWIPEYPQPFSIITEELEWTHEGERFRSRLEYSCQPTQFRVWSLVDVDLYRIQREGGPALSGHPIFHITLRVHLRDADQRETVMDDEKYYATIHTHRGKSATTLASCIQVGRYVEFRKCHVGGSLSGIETGERVVSMAPVKEIRFDSAGG
ncbi:MAG TPA: hypothetical protein VGK99_02910 [Acidobacteriota bacterium]|jgi:hypothetical protein